MTAPVRAGSRAPEFNLPLLGGGYRGLADMVEPGGGVLVFFKEECAASELVLSRIAPLARALEREERLFLAVAQESEVTAGAFRARHDIGFAMASDETPFPISREYAVEVVPTLFVIDGNGTIAERVEGFVKSEYLALGPAMEQALALGTTPAVLDRPEELPEIRPG